MGLSLWLDDNRPVPAGWRAARTAEEAKLHLLHGDVDQMSLDYDLDAPPCDKCQFQCGQHEAEAGLKCKHGCNCHEAGDENGLHLLQWMQQTGHWPKQKPTVHSANLDGALRMKKFVEQHWPGE
jgi:hypothetical protein